MKESEEVALLMALLSVNHLAYRLQLGLLKPHGLTEVQLRILKAVREGHVSSLGDVATHLGTTHSNVTIIVDTLERNGWLLRERSKEDRRVVRLTLTTKAGSLETVDQAHRKALAGVSSRVFTQKDSEEVFKALHSLYNALKDAG